MKVIYSTLQAKHDPPTEIYDGTLEPFAEKAARTHSILNALEADSNFQIIEPDNFPGDVLVSVHTPEYVDYIKDQSEKLGDDEVLRPSNFIMDTYTPIVSSTYLSAKASVNSALTGVDLLIRDGKHVYSLCRPPGHRTDCNHSGGYSYFNNTAIAANYL